MMNCTSVAKASCSHAGSMIPDDRLVDAQLHEMYDPNQERPLANIGIAGTEV
jgi:hypothetical protein